MNVNNLYTLFLNTIQKEMRRRVLLVILIITTLVVLAVNNFTGEMTLQTSEGVTRAGIGTMKFSILFYAITMWNGFLTVLMAADTIRSDFELGVSSSILSRPISRTEYFLGRFLGLFAVILFYYLAGFLLSFFDFNNPFPDGKMILRFFLGLSITGLNVIIYILWGFLASFYIPKLYAAALVFLGIITQLFTNNYFLEGPGENLVDPSGTLQILGYGIHMLLPRPGFINSFSETVFKGEFLPGDFWIQIAHYLVTTSVLFAITLFLFSRKEITGRES